MTEFLLGSLVFKLFVMAYGSSRGFTPLGAPGAVALRNLLVAGVCHACLFLALRSLVAWRPRPARAAAWIHLLVLPAAYLDLCFLRYFGAHLSASQANLVGDGLAAVATLWDHVSRRDLWLALDLPAVLVLGLTTSGPSRPPRRWAGLVAGLLLLGVGGYLRRRCTGPDVLARPANRRYTYPVCWAADLWMACARPQIYPQVAPTSPAPVSTACRRSASTRPRPNLLLLQLESVQAGAPDWLHQGKLVMPYLASWIRSGVYFPSTLSPKMRGMSFDTDIAVLGGFPPPRSSDPYAYAFPAPPYLPGLLATGGYRTVTYDNFLPEFHRSRENHAALGIRDYRSVRDRVWQTQLPRLAQGLPGDREFLGFVDASLAREGGLYLAHVKTISTHGPFDGIGLEPEVAATIGEPFRGDGVLTEYARALRYLDHSLIELLEPRRAELQAGSLVVAIFGDHGAGLPVPAAAIPGLEVEDARRLLVPLVLLGTAHPPVRNEQLAALSDLARTLCSLAQVEVSDAAIGGRDLLTAEPLAELVSPRGVFLPDGRRPLSPPEEARLAYGFGKLGAPR